MSSKQRFFSEFKKSMEAIIEERGIFTVGDLDLLWAKDRLTEFLDLGIIDFIERPTISNIEFEWRRNFIEERRKIISVLIWIGWEAWEDFYGIFNRAIEKNGRHRQRDKEMPLQFQDLDFVIPKLQSLFMATQRLFLPKIIKHQFLTQNMTEHSVLPLINCEEIGKGWGGVVYRCNIPPGYYQDSTGRLSTAQMAVAAKTIERKGYSEEIQNLEMFTRSLQPNHRIMKHLAIIKEQDQQYEDEYRYHIIMEQASFNLNKFLHSVHSFKTKDEDGGISIWNLLGEAAELAGALEWLHESIQIEGEDFKCCHMDLKPDNILVFLDVDRTRVGRWKISDFGISVIRNPIESHKKVDSFSTEFISRIYTKTKLFSGAYLAPELVDSPRRGGQSSDIWSYGCVLVEVVASRLTGSSSLRSLDASRRKDDEAKGDNHSDSYYRDEALNPNVQRWLAALDTALFLDRDAHEIRALRNVKPLLQSMLCINSSDNARPLARSVRKSLINIKKMGSVKKDLHFSKLGATPPGAINLCMFEEAYQKNAIDVLMSRGNRFQADYGLIHQIKQWIMDPKCRLLWISEQWSDEASNSSQICSGILISARSHKEDVPIVIYSCYKDYRVSPDNYPVSPVNLVISLIYQIQKELNLGPQPPTMYQHEFDDILEPCPGKDTFKPGICLLRNLWQLPSHNFLCVIDGFHILEKSKDPGVKAQLQEILSVLGSPDSGANLEGSRGNKTVISTVGRCHLLGTVGRSLDYSDFTSGDEFSLVDRLVSSFAKLK